eukprot:sb/3478537/
MSKFGRRSSTTAPPRTPPIAPLPSNGVKKDFEMNKWQRAYSVHLENLPDQGEGSSEGTGSKWSRRSSTLVGNGVALATLTTHVVKHHKVSDMTYIIPITL